MTPENFNSMNTEQKLAVVLAVLTTIEYDHHLECGICKCGKPYHREGCEAAIVLGRRTGYYSMLPTCTADNPMPKGLLSPHAWNHPDTAPTGRLHEVRCKHCRLVMPYPIDAGKV